MHVAVCIALCVVMCVAVCSLALLRVWQNVRRSWIIDKVDAECSRVAVCIAGCVAVRVAVRVAVCCSVLQRGVFGCLARCSA